MNSTRLLKKAPLTPGFYSICGVQGAGKTSLATALLRTDYKYHRKWRYKQAVTLARRFYAESGVKLDISETLYFSSTEILLDEKRAIRTHEVDLQRLAIPNDDFEVQYLPRGSVVFIMEADILAYARDWATLNTYLRDLIKYCRHNLLTIIFDMQVGGDLDAALRKLNVGTYYVVESGVLRFLFFWKRQTWRFIYIRTQLNAVAKELAKLGVDIKIKVAEWGKFSVWSDVFGFYNSFSGIPYFLYGIEKVGYKYCQHAEDDYSVDGIKRYCEMHPLERPEDMRKRRKAREKVEKDKAAEQKQEEEYTPF